MITAAHNTQDQDRLERIRTRVSQISDLLAMLYTPPTSPDILTLDDVLRRYRLTELGGPALSAIDQSRRINRAVGDYEKIGLCEFHIGLILLHWGDGRGAAQQFMEARQQWSFSHKTDAVCLAYYAAGIAQQHVFEHEKAMRSFGKVNQLIPRIEYTTITRSSNFIEALRQAVESNREQLRDQMWPPALLAGSQPPVLTGSEEAATPPPHSHLTTIPEPARTPVPAHRPVNDRYSWFQVTPIAWSAMSGVNPGDWLLTDTNHDAHVYKPNELIVISQTDMIERGMQLRPQAAHQADTRFYLAFCQLEGRLTGQTAVPVALIGGQILSLPAANIAGPVVGMWRPFHK